jgi:tetratricopeptide (TPR) repeat protein
LPPNPRFSIIDFDLKQNSARQQIEAAFRLADRRALYAARAELLSVLRRIAEARDGVSGTSQHSTALSEALAALNEADDFICPRPDVTGVAKVASEHRTPARKAFPEGCTPAQAMARYFDFAVERFASTVGRSWDASYALYGLGKVYVHIDGEIRPHVRNATAKGIVFYHAALRVDQNNWLAANELGVLLARSGRFIEAASWLRRSVEIAPCAETWHNLAVVYHHSGNLQLAGEAQRLAKTFGYHATAGRQSAVNWVPPDALARRSGNEQEQPHASSPEPQLSAAPVEKKRGFLRGLLTRSTSEAVPRDETATREARNPRTPRNGTHGSQ